MESQPANPYVPDLCRAGPLFAVMLVAELVVVIIMLTPLASLNWQDFSMTSVYCQWLALVCVIFICSVRHYLPLWSRQAALGLCVGLIFLVTLLGSSIVFRVDHTLSLGVINSSASHQAFVVSNTAIGTLVGSAALRYFYILARWRSGVEARAQARIEALQARIRPHFLFNSMNSIASLIRRHPQQAEEAIEDLSDLFRSAMMQQTGLTRFAEERELAMRYLNIEHLRLGERLAVEWQTDALPDAALMLPLVLQPLVENAVYHGIAPRAAGGIITIAARVADRKAIIEISNPLPEQQDAARTRGNALALDNIRQRLEHQYRNLASLEAGATLNAYRVVLSFPLEVAKK